MDWKKTDYVPYGHQLLVPKDYVIKEKKIMWKQILKATLIPILVDYFDKITTKFNAWIKKITE